MNLFELIRGVRSRSAKPQFGSDRVLATLPGSVLVTDLEGRIHVANNAACGLLGYSRAELIGRHIRDIAPQLLPSEAGVPPSSFSDRRLFWRSKSGEQISVSVSAETLTDTAGAPAGVVYSAEDLRRRHEEALRESEARYRTLVESMNEGVIVVDNDDVVRFVNPQFCVMVNYDAADLVGRVATDVLLRAADRPVMEEKVQERRRGVSETYTIDLCKRTGELISVDISAAPLLDAKGQVTGSIGICTDVTDRKRSEAALRESEARYRLMAEHATDLISRLTPRGTYLYVSPASRSLLGYEPGTLVDSPATDLVHPDDVPVLEAFLEALLSSHVTNTITYRVRRSDGTYIAVETTFKGIRPSDTDPVSEFIAVSRDVTARKRAEEQIEYQAYHDALTGLPNRKLFEDRLNIALSHARRQRATGRPGVAAVLLLDVDHFKLVNDTLGHTTGDHLLRVIAMRIGESLRSGDTVARFGGDEFTILLPHLAAAEDAAFVAEKILEAVNAPVDIEGQELYTSASIGIAVHPDNGDSAETLLRNADTAMYRAKEISRNSYQLCSPAMNARAEERLTMKSALYQALEHQDFVLHYQPIVSTDGLISAGSTGAVAGSGPRTRAAGGIHTDGGGVGADPPDRRVGTPRGLPAASGVARGEALRWTIVCKRLSGSARAAESSANRSGDSREHRRSRQPARARDHGKRRSARPPAEPADAHAAQGAGGVDHGRRLRHRLFITHVSSRVPDRSRQDRSILHLRSD